MAENHRGHGTHVRGSGHHTKANLVAAMDASLAGVPAHPASPVAGQGCRLSLDYTQWVLLFRDT